LHKYKIKTQFSLILGLCALLFIAGFYTYNTQSLKKLFSYEFESRTQQNTETVKLGLEVGLAEENLGAVKTIFDWVKNISDFSWIILFDESGQKIASYPDEFSEEINNLEQKIKSQNIDNEIYIQKEKWQSPFVSGRIYIGFSTFLLRAQEKITFEDSLKGTLVIFLFFAFIIGIMVYTMANPLESLRSITQKITSGDMNYKELESIKGNFEIISLSKSFNVMMNALELEREKSEELLLNILPKQIADRLKNGEKVIADSYENIAIIFSDIVGFTEISSKTNPHTLVEMLNAIFSGFDEIIEKYSAEKIKTIGDSYMAAVGLITSEKNPSKLAINIAVEMLQVIEKINKEQNLNLKLRIGVHTGSVIAGVIGKKKFVFDLWGDAVNISSRLESHGLPGCIHVSSAVARASAPEFKFESRGSIAIKGKGEMETFLLK
jgi:class 3 adenylate cyclase